MPTYKYVYFNVKGRGEVPRLIFKLKKQDYEEVRLEFDEWPKHKPNMPYGQIPVLYVDGNPIHQSGAIIRYLAREFDLYGKGPGEVTRVDEMLDTMVDLFQSLVKIKFEKDETKKEELNKSFKETSVPKFLKYMENVITENKADFLVGSQLTAADLAFFDLTERVMLEGNEGIFEKYPRLASLFERVKNQPNIAKYLSDERPKTFF